MHLAVFHNMYESVLLLSQYDCCINHKNKIGETPL